MDPLFYITPIMFVDPSGEFSWNKFFGWFVTGTIAVLSVVAIVAGTAFSGGTAPLLGAISIGAGVGALAGITGSISIQGGFDYADPWKVAKAGGIGAAIGGISGSFSFGVGALAKTYGEILGFALSNMTIGGLEVSKIFSTTLLMTIGGFSGKVIGGIVGGTMANYHASLAFGTYLDLDQSIKQGITGEIPAWLISLFWWIFLKK